MQPPKEISSFQNKPPKESCSYFLSSRHQVHAILAGLISMDQQFTVAIDSAVNAIWGKIP